VLLMGESSAKAQAIVSDIRLADGRSERVVLTSPANPAAIFVMFAGGEGTVEITDSGTIGRYSAISTVPSPPAGRHPSRGRC
jgi:hypothetical protein